MRLGIIGATGWLGSALGKVCCSAESWRRKISC